MKKSAALVVSLLLLLGPITIVEAGIGWGTLSERIESTGGLPTAPVPEDGLSYYFFWTLLPPILL